MKLVATRKTALNGAVFFVGQAVEVGDEEAGAYLATGDFHRVDESRAPRCYRPVLNRMAQPLYTKGGTGWQL